MVFMAFFLVGDMGVGKSCLLHQFTEKKCKSRIIGLVVPTDP